MTRGCISCSDVAITTGPVDPMSERRSAPRKRIALPSGTAAPAKARAATAGLVAEWHLETLSDDLALVVSELVTNAVLHGRPPLHLELQADDRRVTVAVADGSPDGPLPRSADCDAEGGRGMPLIDILSAERGVRPQPPGKTVWAALERH